VIRTTGPLAEDPSRAEIVWNGDGYGVLWHRFSVHYLRLDSSGDVISEKTLNGGTCWAWNGTEYAMVWAEEGAIRFARLDLAGERLAEDVVVGPGDNMTDCSMLWTGSRYAAVWTTRENDVKDVFLAILDADGVAQAPLIRVPDAAPGDAYTPSVTFTGTEYGVAFTDERSGFSKVHLARFDETGTKLGPDVEVSVGSPYLSRYPSVFWTGIEYGVVFEHRNTLYYQTFGCGCFDRDRDGFRSCLGDCNDSSFLIYPGAAERCNGVDDDCDTLVDEDAFGEDTDHDLHANLCDNCPQVANPWQGDDDHDGQGDVCDVDDGVIFLRFADPDVIEWDAETGFEGWNLYRGDIGILLGGGPYTQQPGSVPLALRFCELDQTSSAQAVTPASGAAAFYLATGLAGGIESELGEDTSGSPRPNANPCPSP